ncbi:MAG: hypothetical protein IPM92_06640 [Saprospiraceae bacterium]|nr:hypothetical protein [Saprospiraceae bacterium]
MAQYYHYDAEKIENGNKRIGYLISAIVHALILFIILWRFLELPVEPPQEYAIELLGPTPQYVEPIVEQDPGGGNSAGPEDTEPQEGGSPGSEAPESKTPEDAVKVVDKIEEKIEPVKTTPIPTTPNPKPVIVAPTPEVVKVDPPKKIEVPGPTRPGPIPNNNPSPVVTKPNTQSGGGSGTSGNGNSGDDDAPGSGGSGTGSGGGTGAGGANTGSGTGGGGGTGSGTGGGSGDGAGVDFDEIGVLKRKVISRPDLSGLARPTPQTVVFNMCVNREGAVTYIRYNPKLSKTKEVNFIREATQKMQLYKFQPDPKAARKECGTYSFTASGVIQRLN